MSPHDCELEARLPRDLWMDCDYLSAVVCGLSTGLFSLRYSSKCVCSVVLVSVIMNPLHRRSGILHSQNNLGALRRDMSLPDHLLRG